MRRLGTEQEVAVEVDGRLQATGGVEPDRNAGGALAAGVGIHAEGEHDVGIAREPHRAERHRLERLLGHLAEHRGGEEPDLGARLGSSPAATGSPSAPMTACMGVTRSE